MGDRSAWSQIYAECHRPLELAIRIMLGRQASRHDLIDEIAARVWFSVVDRDCELLDRFDADRGCRLATFLAGIARNEISNHFRAERRRKRREAMAPSNRSEVVSSVNSVYWSVANVDAMLGEFLVTLSPREREYCERHLLGINDFEPTEFSSTNRWQLQRRIRQKLWRYLGSEV